MFVNCGEDVFVPDMVTGLRWIWGSDNTVSSFMPGAFLQTRNLPVLAGAVGKSAWTTNEKQSP